MPAHIEWSKDLYRRVRSMVRSVKQGAPFSTGTLANELFLKVWKRKDLEFPSEAALLAFLRRAVPSIVVDKVRERKTKKRFAEFEPLTLGKEIADACDTPERLVACCEALERLAQEKPRAHLVVEMYGQGMALSEIAEKLELSQSAIERDWLLAKAYLLGILRES